MRALPLSNALEVLERAVPCLPAARNGEESDSYPNVVARLGHDWRIIVCRDGIQWIVQRCAGTRHGRARWEARCYCRTREGLLRRCRGFLGELPDDIAADLARLPTHIEGRTQQ
jgi:hypothetical protein